MTRLALVRVPDDAPCPAGLIGWYTTRAPRRYAVVTDLTAWVAWVAEHAPDAIAPCGHVDRAFEATVRRWVAKAGTWTCGHCASEVAPDGMEARQESTGPRLHCTLPTGVVWDSALDVTPEAVTA